MNSVSRDALWCSHLENRITFAMDCGVRDDGQRASKITVPHSVTKAAGGQVVSLSAAETSVSHLPFLFAPRRGSCAPAYKANQTCKRVTI